MPATIRTRDEAAGRLSRGRPTAQPASATASVAAVLRGPRRPATIVARGPYAVYARDDDAVVAVLARDAVQVPCGLATAWDHLGDVREITLGGGVCTVDRRDLRVGRLVDATVRRRATVPVLDVEHRVALTAAVRPDLPGLPSGTYEALREDDPAATGALLGRGPGLTPLGDDVLAGWLVGRYAQGHRGGRVAAAVLSDAHARTTTVSAVLLAHAVRGEAIPALCDHVAALGGLGGPASLTVLRAVGHTSGTGLALGVALSFPSGDLPSPALPSPAQPSHNLPSPDLSTRPPSPHGPDDRRRGDR